MLPAFQEAKPKELDAVSAQNVVVLFCSEELTEASFRRPPSVENKNI
jgi:hypothetical protein